MLTFSVVMPLYNKRHYVQEAVYSVLDQSLNHFELIVIDDGSTDGGADVAKQISDPRVILVSQANAGVSAARNSGIRQAKGKYICFLDADDRWEKDHLKDLFDLATSFSDAALYGTAYYEIWNDAKVSPSLPKEVTAAGNVQVKDFYKLWSKFPFIYTSSIMVNREFWLQSGILFPADEKQGEDQEVWFRLAELGGVAFNSNRSVGYRREISSSLSAIKPKEVLPCYARLISRLRGNSMPSHLRKGGQRLVAKHQLDVAWINILGGFDAAAWQMLFARYSSHIPAYWIRCFLFLLIPNLLRRKSISFFKDLSRGRHSPI